MSHAKLSKPLLDVGPDAAVLAKIDSPRPEPSTTTSPAHKITAPDDPAFLKARAGRYPGIDDLLERLSPRADPRDEDLMYRQLLRDLRSEYDVDGPSIEYLIAVLAGDMLQAGRYRQAIEMLQNLDEIRENELADFEKRRQHAADQFTALTLQTMLAQGLVLNAERAAAVRLAKRMACRVHGCYADLVTEPYTDEDIANLHEVQREQLDETRALGAVILPFKDVLGNEDRLFELLTGERLPTPEERKGLAALLDWAVSTLAMLRYDASGGGINRRYQTSGSSKLCTDADAVRQILILDTALRQTNKAIENTLKLLSKHRVPKNKAR